MVEPIDVPEDLDDSRIAVVAKVWDDGEAEMIRQILLDYGIPVSVQSDVLHTLFPLRVDGLGEIRVLVPEDRLSEAKELLAEHRRQGFEVIGERGPGDEADDTTSSDLSTSDDGRPSEDDPPARRRDEGEGR